MPPERDFHPLDFMIGFGETLPESPTISVNRPTGATATPGDAGMPWSQWKDLQDAAISQPAASETTKTVSEQLKHGKP